MSKQLYHNQALLGFATPVRVLFPPTLDTPKKIGNKGDPKYEVQIGFPADHPEFADHWGYVEALAKEKWGDGITIDYDPKVSDYDVKFKDGNEEYEYHLNHPDEAKRKEYPQLKDMVIMKLRSKNPISVFDARRKDEAGRPVRITDAEEMKALIYAGCYVAFDLTYATYDAPGRGDKPGVSAYPEKICFVKDGERLSSGGKSDGSVFAAVQGVITDENPFGDSNE